MGSKVVAICGLVIVGIVVVASHFGSLAFGYVDVPSNKYISPEILCHSTAHPSFCKSVLPAQRKTILHPMQKQHLPLPMTSDGVIGSFTVRKDGTGNFKTINEAVSATPDNSNNGYFVIHVSEDVYEEKVIIGENKKNIMMIGAGIYKTIITGHRNKADEPKIHTYETATFSVEGFGFVGVNMTIQNTAGPWKEQAVALHNIANQSAFYMCSFEAYQDTLYTRSNIQFYRECDIYGTVDFIFGDAAAILQKCNIYVRKPLSSQFNAIAASSREEEDDLTAIVIHNCKIRAAVDLVANMSGTKSFLGRPWKEYARTVYMQNDIGGFIEKEGWHIWDGDFALKTLYYAEFNNTGDGSSTDLRVTWPGYHVLTNPSDLASFTVANFISGPTWLPTTGVPFDPSFI